MDWHASVYGSRSGSDSFGNGRGGYRSYDDDNDGDDDYGVTYGSYDSDDAYDGDAYPYAYDDSTRRRFGGTATSSTYADPARRRIGDIGGPSYGAGPIVSDTTLRKRGGRSYFRANEILASHRMHDFTCAVTDSGVSLAALVNAADRYADDYRVSVDVDDNAGDLVASHCTCPAYGRFSGICKHVIALVMAYNSHRDWFRRVAGAGNGAANGRLIAGRLPAVRRTSRELATFMRQRDADMQAKAKDRQLSLLKEIGTIADAGGTTDGGCTGAVRHMPIGSVTLRLTLETHDDTGCSIKLRIQVPSRGISYVVKDIAELLQAVRYQEFVSYGKKLAFIHTRDAFDRRSQAVLDILDRAQTIRGTIDSDPYVSLRRTDAAAMRLSDGEIADLLDVYAGTDATIDYAPSARYYMPVMPTRVVDGDPDLGLSMTRAEGSGADDADGATGDASGMVGATGTFGARRVDDDSAAPAGYWLRHTQCVERFIAGQRSTYVIVRPLSAAVLAADANTTGDTGGRPATGGARDTAVARGTAAGHDAPTPIGGPFVNGFPDEFPGGVGGNPGGNMGGTDIVQWLRANASRAQSHAAVAPATIYRCDANLAKQRDLLTLLCGDDDHASLYLGAADVAMFARTMLPLLTAGGAGRGESAGPANVRSRDNVRHDDNVGDDVADYDNVRNDDNVRDPRAVPSSAIDDETNATPRTGLHIDLPPELLRLIRVPCRIAIYLDRDLHGITCDVQARYGNKRYHVFDGIGHAPDDQLRDKDAERLAVEAVLHYFPRPSGAVAFIPESDDNAVYKLLTEGLPVLRGLGDVYATPAFDGLAAMPRPTIKVGLSVRSGLVEISPIADEIDPDDVPALLASYRKRKRFHRLRNGAFVDLRTVDTSALDDVAADLGLKPSELETGAVTVPAFEAYYLDSQIDDAGKDASFRAYLNDLRVIDPNAYHVPASLADVLRPYQAEGFRWLNAVCDKGFGGILADEMGLGKTVQLLSFLLARRDEARAACTPSLIVCPASLVYNWAAEAAKFATSLRVETVAGSKASRRATLSEIRDAQQDDRQAVRDDADGANDGTTTDIPDLLVTSYDLLRRDIDDYAGLAFYCMTLDEAQYIKNAATKAAKAVRSIAAAHRFALTGTPIENRLSELWSIFDFLMPGMLGSYAHFRERFEMPILSGDESAQRKLQSFVGPFILRRLKSQVLKDLPDKIENVITVQLAGEQRKLYAALEQQLRSAILKQKPADFNTGKIQILAQLTKLRQVCCDPRLLYDNAGRADAVDGANGGRIVEQAVEQGAEQGAEQSVKQAVEQGDMLAQSSVKQPVKHGKVSSAKLDAIAELVDSCRDAGRKMLIFSQFTSYLDLIAERLRANGVAYDVITGATPKKRRLELVDQFNRDETPVFLISLKAGNTGLNLTGACVVVHADPWWNAAAQNQATDRAHRIGQTQDVNVYQIVAKDTIEERILNLQRSKTDLAERFVDAASSSTGRSVAALTKDDLLALLG
ncbi:helicase [Bifidobacterium ramosum]|nr:DEAD/DEAH box helicase [Bifidobacterium ramosum]KAB8287080.1 helicase [Bifidobacterium ramosum]